MPDKKINQDPKQIVQACGNSFAYLLCPLWEHVVINGRVSPPNEIGRVRYPKLWVSAALFESGRNLVVYAEGGARGAICEKAGPVAGATSSSNAKAAIGWRTATQSGASV